MIIGEMIVGIGIGVPITYFLSCIMTFTGEPILWATILFIGVSIAVGRLVKVKRKASGSPLTISDMLIVLFSFIFGSWLMMKTFRAGGGGQLFVGSNNVFDFAHALGIIRSFSWGNNIPLSSPFESGLPFFYHFFFYFFVALWEYFGVPIVWAMNILSILSFASLLVMVYFLPQVLMKQGKLVGWVAVLLTITHSTLTFWYLIFQKGFNTSFVHTIWRLPTYPFAGPFDGSVISIFMTLNNYVNQRHLAFGIALGLFLIMCLIKLFDDKQLTKVKSSVLGVVTGCMFFWNIPISAIVGAIIVFFMLFKRRLSEAVAFSVSALIVVGIFLAPFIPGWKSVWSLILVVQGVQIGDVAGRIPEWNIFQYWWANLGILPVVALLGWLVIPKDRRRTMLPFLLLFIGLCFFAAYGKRGFDQKFLSFLIIPINILAATAGIWLWKQKSVMVKFVSIIIVFVLTISGFVDLFAIKNEFAFPLVEGDMVPVISWIGTNTPKNAVFVSYRDMIDPIVFAGRKNFFGFFGNLGWNVRSEPVGRIYRGDVGLARASDISYVLIPKWKKSDFPYIVNEQFFRSHFATAFESERYVIFRTK